MSTPRFALKRRLLYTYGITCVLTFSACLVHAVGVSANFNTAHKLYLKWTTSQQPQYLAQAITYLKRAEAQDPKNPVVLQWIGYIYIQQKQYALAVDPLARAAQQSNTQAQPYINLGYCYFKLARYQDAANAFQRAKTSNLLQLKSDPKNQIFRINSFQIYANLGSSLFHLREFSRSAKAFRAAMKADSAIAVGASNNKDIKILGIDARPGREGGIQDGLGATLVADGNLAEATDALQQATLLQPDNAAYRSDLGRAYANAAIAAPAGSASAAKLWIAASQADAMAVNLDPQNYHNQELYAITLVELKKYPEAVRQFEDAARTRSSVAPTHPESYDVLFHYGEACLYDDKLNEALVLFTRAAKQRPKRPAAWEWAGYTALQRKDYTSAIFSLQHAEALVPRSSKVLLNLGKAQFLNGNYADAQTTYTSLCEIDPNSADAYYNLGNSYVKLADFTSAVKAYSRATQLDPNSTSIPNGLAFAGLGYALVHSGDLQPAEVAFSRALNIDATNVDAATGLALASTTLARSANTTTAWNAAADALKRATVLAPGNADLQVAYGESLVRSNQDLKAQAVLMKAVATSPNNGVALKLLAKAQQNQGDIVGETNTLARLAAAYPTNVRYLQLLANAQMVQLDYGAAAITLTSIVHAQPSNLAAAFQLYTALSHTGHIHQALNVLHTASLQPGPGSAKAVIYNALGDEAYSSAPKHDHAAVITAQHYFYEALAADHSSVDALKGLGVTALKLGAFKHAVAFLSKAIAANSQDAPTYVARGYAYERLQNIKAAITDYRAALQLDPQNAAARADLQRFAVVTKS